MSPFRPFPGPVFDAEAIDGLSIDDLIAVGSDKWTRYPGCIGAFIAEMDYGLAPCIQEALDEAVDQCALGYIPAPAKRAVGEACARWMDRLYGWKLDPGCIRPLPDIIEAYELFLRQIVGAGNKVIVPTPAYMPFLSMPRLFDVEVVEVPMIRKADHWEYDWRAIEDVFRAGCRAFVLCNPHNPIGKIATLDELRTLSALLDKYGARVFVDEIHAPMIFEGGEHIPYAMIGEREARQAVTATSVSKGFNVPGTKCAQVILTNPDDLEHWMAHNEWSEHQTATIGTVATIAAYDKGKPWLDEVLKYLKRNEELLTERLTRDMPAVRYIPPEGTYIAWLDFTNYGLEQPAEWFREHARIAFTEGSECGGVGTGCVRMNFAMPYPLLEECLNRMERALATLTPVNK